MAMKVIGALVSLFLFCSIHPLASAAEDAKGSSWSLLHKTTVITGDSSASVKVRLSRDAVVDTRQLGNGPDGPNPGVVIHGRGRFAGIVIVPEPYEPDLFTPIVLGRFRLCNKKGCARDKYINIAHVGRDEVTLPRGTYRIHLVADGAPVKVELTLKGLEEGVARLRPQEPSAVDLQTPREAALSDGEHYWAAGSTFHGGRVGLSVTAIWAELADTAKEFGMGVCRPETSPFEIPHDAYGPWCNAVSLGFGSGGWWIAPEQRDDELWMTAEIGYHDQGDVFPFRDDDYSLGVWLTSPEVAMEKVGSTTFFVELADTWS